MPDPTEALAQRIASMRDEELVAVLDSKEEYTAEALQLAEQEAERRGGPEQLRERAGPRSSGVAPKSNWLSRLSSGEIAWPLGPLWHWLLPERERFARYPILRFVVSVLRLLILVVLMAPVGVALALVLAAVSPEPSPGPDHMFIVVLINLFLGVVALLTVQAVILVLVDTESNTRETRELLKEMVAGKGEG